MSQKQSLQHYQPTDKIYPHKPSPSLRSVGRTLPPGQSTFAKGSYCRQAIQSLLLWQCASTSPLCCPLPSQALCQALLGSVLSAHSAASELALLFGLGLPETTLTLSTCSLTTEHRLVLHDTDCAPNTAVVDPAGRRMTHHSDLHNKV